MLLDGTLSLLTRTFVKQSLSTTLNRENQPPKRCKLCFSWCKLVNGAMGSDVVGERKLHVSQDCGAGVARGKAGYLQKEAGLRYAYVMGEKVDI